MQEHLDPSLRTPEHDSLAARDVVRKWPRALIVAAVLVAGCTAKAPTGQVLAVVNGQDITGQDLEAEARGAGQPGAKASPELLQRVVARVLLAQAAHTRKLDQYPGYPADRLRLEQNFLAQRMAQALVNPASLHPSPADVEKFMASHPYAFARRERLKLDQIRFTSPVNLPDKGLDTMFALTDRLKNIGVTFERGQQAIDTAQLPASYVDGLLALPSGKPFFLRQGDVMVANVITGVEKIDVPQAQQVAIATRNLEQLRVSQQIDGEVNRLRGQAKITYQPAFAPKPVQPNGSSAKPPAAGDATKP